MDVHLLRVFSSVFRHRCFPRAAADLRLIRPAVSGNVAELERAPGASLFDRAFLEPPSSRETA